MDLEVTRNQYGEEIATSALTYDQDRGVFVHETLSCWNAEHLGMGTCRCVSHNTWEKEDISRSEAIDLIEKASLKFWGGLDQEAQAALTDERLEICIDERIVLAGFSGQADLCATLEAAYRLGLNPLPKVRGILKGLPLTVAFAYEGNVHFDASPRDAVFAVFLDSDAGTVRTELFCSYFDKGRDCWMEVQENEDVRIS
ncbi:MAG: hypothetical protein JRF53_16830 [Deltaproteobacteria bacterium]|nr:hypothetical protein [Deltaproteobacteria bacterium]